MTQNANDVEIANQGFAAFRQDLNDVLEDITTLHSGDTAPTTTYANQFWYETDTDKLYIRNEDNDAWIELFTLDQVNDKLKSLTLSGDFTVDTDTLHVDSANNRVGIGTISAANKLEVNGAVVALGAATAYTNTGLYIQNKGASVFDVGAWRSGASAAELTFSTDSGSDAAPTERMRITGTGNVLVGGTTSPSGSGQIVATGGVYLGGTGAVNHLDDYQEGNWTPTFGRTSTPFTTTPTYSSRTGRYIKVGKLVHATCYIRFSNNFSGGSGNYKVDGLPFTAGSQLQGVANGLTTVFAGDLNHSRGNYVSGTTVRYDAGNSLNPTTTNAYLTFTVTYEVT